MLVKSGYRFLFSWDCFEAKIKGDAALAVGWLTNPLLKPPWRITHPMLYCQTQLHRYPSFILPYVPTKLNVLFIPWLPLPTKVRCGVTWILPSPKALDTSLGELCINRNCICMNRIQDTVTASLLKKKQKKKADKKRKRKLKP